MKKIFLALLIFIIFFGCKKNSYNPNIILYDKPGSVIWSYIKGKWKVHYMMGGICGTCKFDREQYNEYFEFLPNGRIRYSYKNQVLADTTISWIKYLPSGHTDSIAVMEFYDKRLYPNHYSTDNIFNDTLILCSPAMFSPDNTFHYLTRVK